MKQAILIIFALTVVGAMIGASLQKGGYSDRVLRNTLIVAGKNRADKRMTKQEIDATLALPRRPVIDVDSAKIMHDDWLWVDDDMSVAIRFCGHELQGRTLFDIREAKR